MLKKPIIDCTAVLILCISCHGEDLKKKIYGLVLFVLDIDRISRDKPFPHANCEQQEGPSPADGAGKCRTSFLLEISF